MVYEIKDKVILVTGAANGIGAGIVKQFLAEGAKHVAVLDIAEADGVALQDELNRKYGSGHVKFFKCDVTNQEQFFKAFDDTLKQYNYIDIVVNNAGIMNDSQRSYKLEIDINVTALVTGTLKAMEIMRKDRGGKGGAVINISSIAGLHQAHVLPIYYATKSAVIQFSNCIGMEPTFSKTGVRVLTVCFGATNTELLSKKKVGCYDEGIVDELMDLIGKLHTQRLESAVRGVVDAYKFGASGSTWLADKDEAPVDITQDILAGYDTMATHYDDVLKK